MNLKSTFWFIPQQCAAGMPLQSNGIMSNAGLTWSLTELKRKGIHMADPKIWDKGCVVDDDNDEDESDKDRVNQVSTK